MCHMSRVRCHMSRVRCHMSLFNLSQTVIARDLQFSHNIHYSLCVQCHMSGVTYQVSHVRCHMSLFMCHVPCVMCYVSFVIYIFFTKWLSWLVEALLSKGPTPSSFFLFFFYKRFDTQYLLISACSGPFWVIKKSKLMRIQF